MKKIIIVCAGSFAVEVYDVIRGINIMSECEGLGKQYEILGFLSDVDVDLDVYNIDSKIIGRIQDWYPIDDEVYALGVAMPDSKQKLAKLLKDRGCKFETLISRTVPFWNEINTGEGTIITGFCVGPRVKIGSFVSVMGSMIGNGAEIGDYSTTTGYTNVTTAKIGQRVLVGSHAVVLNGLKVGNDAVIGAGSVVITNVKPGTSVFGNPARKV